MKRRYSKRQRTLRSSCKSCEACDDAGKDSKKLKVDKVPHPTPSVQELRKMLLRIDSLDLLRDLSLSLTIISPRASKNALKMMQEGFHSLPHHCIPLASRMLAASTHLFDLLSEWSEGKCIANCEDNDCDCECHENYDNVIFDDDDPRDFEDPCEDCLTSEEWELNWHSVHKYIDMQLKKEVLPLLATDKGYDATRFLSDFVDTLVRFDEEPDITGDIETRTGSDSLTENKEDESEHICDKVCEIVSEHELADIVRQRLWKDASNWVDLGMPFGDLLAVLAVESDGE